MSSGLLPGRSVRPHPSRNSVSPLTSRPSHLEALAARGVAGRVHQRDLDGADLHDVAGIVNGQMIVADPCRAAYPRRLVALHVDRAVDPLQQVGDALDRVAHHRSADVIGVVVRGQHAGDPHAVGRRPCR